MQKLTVRSGVALSYYVKGCRPGSVVRTSVFSWRTFPDLRL